MKTNFSSRGPAERKAFELAELAKVELKKVYFSLKEAQKDGLRVTPFDKNRARAGILLGFCWRGNKTIFLNLPTTIDTIAHEVNHLRTRTSHYSKSFRNQVYAMLHGKDPKTKINTYRITIIRTETYEIDALTPAIAKKQGGAIRNHHTTITKITAKKIL